MAPSPGVVDCEKVLPIMFSAIRRRFDDLPSNIKGAVFLMASALFFSAMLATIKLLGQKYHITQILLVRQAIMIVIISPAILKDFPGALRTKQPFLQFVRVVFALLAMYLGFTALIHLKLADATAIGFSKSFFITIFAVIILKETVGIRRGLAVAIGFLGVMVMLRPGADAFSVYGLYSMVSAACAGFVMVIIRLMSRVDSPVTILAYQAFGAGVIMVVPGIWYWQWPTLAETLLFATMGVVSYVAQIFNIHAYKWGEASLLASLDYVRLLYAVAFGYFLFASLPGPQTLIGASIVVAASIYTIHREAKLKQTLVRGPQGRGIAS